MCKLFALILGIYTKPNFLINVHSRLIPIKGVAGKAHHFAGAGNVAKFGGQIQ